MISRYVPHRTIEPNFRAKCCVFFNRTTCSIPRRPHFAAQATPFRLLPTQVNDLRRFYRLELRTAIIAGITNFAIQWSAWWQTRRRREDLLNDSVSLPLVRTGTANIAMRAQSDRRSDDAPGQSSQRWTLLASTIHHLVTISESPLLRTIAKVLRSLHALYPQSVPCQRHLNLVSKHSAGSGSRCD